MITTPTTAARRSRPHIVSPPLVELRRKTDHLETRRAQHQFNMPMHRAKASHRCLGQVRCSIMDGSFLTTGGETAFLLSLVLVAAT